MLEMSVAEADLGLTSLVFSHKTDVTDDKSLKGRKIKGAHMKRV